MEVVLGSRLSENLGKFQPSVGVRSIRPDIKA